MKEDPKGEKTSRRQFTKAIVTAAVAAPVITSIASCAKPSEPTPSTAAKSDEGPKASACFGVKPGTGIPAEHIPPMGIDGGNGSIIVETHNKLVKKPGAAFEYEDAPELPDDRYGELEQVRVI